MTMSVVVAESSVFSPPITPAMPIAPFSSVMSRSSVVSARVMPSRVTIFSPSVARRTAIGPASFALS